MPSSIHVQPAAGVEPKSALIAKEPACWAKAATCARSAISIASGKRPGSSSTPTAPLRFLPQIFRFSPLQTLAATITGWIEPIACMWRTTRNNGITEGFHRKMKLIQRRAYGFRNFENYRLRVIAQCG